MSLVLYGPPGTGKTTLAHVISLATERQFVQLSALDAGVKEVRAVIDERHARAHRTPAGSTVLFIDEVHRFSKTQQDSLLGAVEDRIVSLIAATTENPFFSVVSPAAVAAAWCCAAAADRRRHPRRAATGRWPTSAGSTARSRSPRRREEHLVALAGGDARKALTALEAGGRRGAVARRAAPRSTWPPLETAVDAAAVRYDRHGRPALRRHQRVHQEHPRQRRRRRPALPGPDGRGGGGPAVHRPAAGDLRQRGHRHGRPDGAAHRGRRRRTRSQLHRHAGGADRAGAGRRSPGDGAEVERGDRWPSSERWPTCGRAWPARCRRACATRTTPAPRSSATARPTTTRTTQPDGVVAAAVPAGRAGREGLLPAHQPGRRGADRRAAGQAAGDHPPHPLSRCRRALVIA